MTVLVALACTAACGTGGSGEDGKSSRRATDGRTPGSDGRTGTPDRNSPGSQDPQDTQESRDSRDAQDLQGTPGTPGTPDTRRTARRPLSGAQLKKAVLVTGDVKGYEVNTSDAADLLNRSVPAAPSKCQPVADMFLFATDPAPAAGVSRGVGAKDELDASVTTLALLSYGSGDAEEVMDGLRSATEDCTAYRHTGYDYKNVKALPGPDQGDESLAFRLVASIEGARVPVACTVVREGTTLVAFNSMNMLEAGGAEVPAELVGAQLKKLVRTAG
ncbi:hypothetical protein [Streptomyces sp. V3I8]|uniref:hypothetical protein n=1 Tax=Streptomyces sp. V3I8 TaxID=3042279 RepID=UPI0027D91592|nr:hypothetical protein [Streptomyces sp. V3I8]